MPNKDRGLHVLRQRKGETQEQTASALGMNYKTYNHYENQRRKPRDLDTLVAMADHFDVSVEELIWHLGARSGESGHSSSHATSTA